MHCSIFQARSLDFELVLAPKVLAIYQFVLMLNTKDEAAIKLICCLVLRISSK